MSLSALKVGAVNLGLVSYEHPALDEIIEAETAAILVSLNSRKDACASLHEQLSAVTDLEAGEYLSLNTSSVVDQNGDTFPDTKIVLEDQAIGFDANLMLPILNYMDPITNEECKVLFKAKRDLFSFETLDPMQNMRDLVLEDLEDLTQSIQAVRMYPPKLYAFIVGDVAANLGLKGYEPEPIGRTKWFDVALFWTNLIVMAWLAFEAVLAVPAKLETGNAHDSEE